VCIDSRTLQSTQMTMRQVYATHRFIPQGVNPKMVSAKSEPEPTKFKTFQYQLCNVARTPSNKFILLGNIVRYGHQIMAYADL
jgi:hypothetical protein